MQRLNDIYLSAKQKCLENGANPLVFEETDAKLADLMEVQKSKIKGGNSISEKLEKQTND